MSPVGVTSRGSPSAHRLAVVLLTAIAAVVLAPDVRAEDNVTYEVLSDDVATASIEYFDHSQRVLLRDVPLPWRMNAAVLDAGSPSTSGAEVRADWRSSIAAFPVWRPGKWVTVRITRGGKVLCQNTLDVGNAACYGSTPFKS